MTVTLRPREPHVSFDRKYEEIQCNMPYPHTRCILEEGTKNSLIEKLNTFNERILEPVGYLIAAYLGCEKDLLDAISEGDKIKLIFLYHYGIDWYNHYKNRAVYSSISRPYKPFPGIDLNTSLTHGDTPLMIAVETDSFPFVQILLENPEIDVNALNKHGDTALMIAAYKGFDKIVGSLINKKAEIFLKNIKGKSALMLASEEGHFKIKGFLERKIEGLITLKDSEDPHGKPPAQDAASYLADRAILFKEATKILTVITLAIFTSKLIFGLETDLIFPMFMSTGVLCVIWGGVSAIAKLTETKAQKILKIK